MEGALCHLLDAVSLCHNWLWRILKTSSSIFIWTSEYYQLKALHGGCGWLRALITYFRNGSYVMFLEFSLLLCMKFAAPRWEWVIGSFSIGLMYPIEFFHCILQ